MPTASERKRGPDTYRRKRFHIPTAATRQRVTDLTGVLGYPNAEVAACLRISVGTLVRHYRHELTHARTVANLSVGRNLLAMATKPGNFQAARYWMGTRCGWSDKKAEAVAVPTNPGPTWDVLFKPQQNGIAEDRAL